MTGAYMYSTVVPDMVSKDDGMMILINPAENGYSRPGSHQAFPPKLMRTSSDEMGWRLAEGSYDGRDMSLMWQTKKVYDEKPTTIVTRYPKNASLALGFSNVSRSIDDALAKALEEKGKDATISVVYQHNHMYPIFE